MAFAKKNDIQIIETYIDRALSAKTDNRPDFQRMIKDCAKKKFDVILLWKLDRFARNKYDSAHYRHILGKNNVKIVSATEQISDGPEGILLTSLEEYRRSSRKNFSIKLRTEWHKRKKLRQNTKPKTNIC